MSRAPGVASGVARSGPTSVCFSPLQRNTVAIRNGRLTSIPAVHCVSSRSASSACTAPYFRRRGGSTDVAPRDNDLRRGARPNNIAPNTLTGPG